MLPVIRPDVIKLDLKVTQGTPSREAMRVLHFAYEEVERTGATILAEGVETKHHDEVVRALGAPLAQGWLYGKPTDDPTPAEQHQAHMSLGAVGLQDVRSPFEVLGGKQIYRAPRDLLRSLADEVFRHGFHLLPPALLVVLVPDPEALTKHHLRALSQMARRQVITGVIGAGMPPAGARGARFTKTRPGACRAVRGHRAQPKHSRRGAGATDTLDSTRLLLRRNPRPPTDHDRRPLPAAAARTSACQRLTGHTSRTGRRWHG